MKTRMWAKTRTRVHALQTLLRRVNACTACTATNDKDIKTASRRTIEKLSPRQPRTCKQHTTMTDYPRITPGYAMKQQKQLKRCLAEDTSHAYNTCGHACVHACLRAYKAYMHAGRQAGRQADRQAGTLYLLTYLHMHACMHAHIHVLTCMHADIQTHIRTSHTYIYASILSPYIHTSIRTLTCLHACVHPAKRQHRTNGLACNQLRRT